MLLMYDILYTPHVQMQIAGVAAAAPCVATPLLLMNYVLNGKNCCRLIESDSYA